MADVEKESNNNDQMQLTNTPEKDNENRGGKKVCKKIVRSRRGEGVQLLPLLGVVLLRLAQVGTISIRVNRKENAGKRHGAFPRKVKRVINQKKWRTSSLRKDLPF